MVMHVCRPRRTKRWRCKAIGRDKVCHTVAALPRTHAMRRHPLWRVRKPGAVAGRPRRASGLAFASKQIQRRATRNSECLCVMLKSRRRLSFHAASSVAKALWQGSWPSLAQTVLPNLTRALALPTPGGPAPQRLQGGCVYHITVDRLHKSCSVARAGVYSPSSRHGVHGAGLDGAPARAGEEGRGRRHRP